jgi:MmeI, target recognition domain
LQSGIHWAWFKSRCSTLKGDFRYTADTVFDAFPWPQFDSVAQASPPASSGGVPAPGSTERGRSANSQAGTPALQKIRVVAEAAVSLRALRREIMAANGWSLRDLYRTLETPGTNRLRDAQAALDSAVRAAYGMKATEDILAFLLHLNLDLADLETKGQFITPPGLPLPTSHAGEFISSDCIEPV